MWYEHEKTDQFDLSKPVIAHNIDNKIFENREYLLLVKLPDNTYNWLNLQTGNWLKQKSWDNAESAIHYFLLEADTYEVFNASLFIGNQATA